MNPWALITVSWLDGMLVTGAIAAVAARRADFAGAMAIAAVVLGVGLAGYANGVRALVYRDGAVTPVRIVAPKSFIDRVPMAAVPPPALPVKSRASNPN